VIINTDSYEYNDSSWEDLLTKYNNDTITYDVIGNPTTIGSNSLTWINGRQLQSYSSNGLSITYKYNVNGIRTEKNVNGIKTDYYLSDNNIIYEKTNNNIIYYYYDSSGPCGLEYNNMIYYYVKNLHGDIVGILNSNYEQIVKYEYDAYGNVLSIKDSNNQIITDQSNIGIINPFRYRGYYYDKETNLYYLNSRYYNPEWGRFINSDKVLGINRDLLSYNLFLYVSNNPIMFLDKTGFGKTYVIAYNPSQSDGKPLYKQAVHSAEYDADDENVIIVSVTSGEDFIDKWNSMDDYGEIDYVFLYLHGDEGKLYFYNETFNLEDFEKLEYQVVNKNVVDFSCRGAAGHTSGKSVIDALSKKTNASVTGNLFGVSYDKTFNGYKARTEYLNINRIIHIFSFQPVWITVQRKQADLVSQVAALAGAVVGVALAMLKK
jgi:RHS repeat-associated protein